MKNLISKLPSFPADKANHHLYGTWYALFGAGVCLLAGWPIWAGALIGCTIPAVGKEVIDKVSGKGTPEVMDAVYTIAGGVPVALVGLLCN